MIVVDTNLVAYLLINGEHTDAAQDALRSDPEWVTPKQLFFELLNVLSTYCRQSLLTIDEAEEAYRRAQSLVHEMPFDVNARAVLELSAQSGVSGYDCIFVAAARSNDLPLVTFDRQLLAKFPDTAVKPDQIGAWFDQRRARRQQ
jgi:predicted nucleic acid-binding protein